MKNILIFLLLLCFYIFCFYYINPNDCRTYSTCNQHSLSKGSSRMTHSTSIYVIWRSNDTSKKMLQNCFLFNIIYIIYMLYSHHWSNRYAILSHYYKTMWFLGLFYKLIIIIEMEGITDSSFLIIVHPSWLILLVSVPMLLQNPFLFLITCTWTINLVV